MNIDVSAYREYTQALLQTPGTDDGCSVWETKFFLCFSQRLGSFVTNGKKKDWPRQTYETPNLKH